MPLTEGCPHNMIRTNYTEDDFNTAANGICPGPDFEWFAVDRDFNVAGFTNAGLAVVPQTVFKSFSIFTDAVDAVCSLQRTGCASWVREKPPRFDTWDDWSQHGLFAYDWGHAIGQSDPRLPYQLMCCPDDPVHLSALPQPVADYIARTQFNLSFRESNSILVA